METAPDPGQWAALMHALLGQVSGFSPLAQATAMLAVGAIACMWIWTRRPQPGVDAAMVTEALRVTAQAQTETAASMRSMVQQTEAIAEDVRAMVREVRGMVESAARMQRSPANRTRHEDRVS